MREISYLWDSTEWVERSSTGPCAPVRRPLMTKTTKPNTAGVGVGDFAPDFSLPSLGSNEVRLSDFKGRRVVLFFWASW